MKEIDLYKPVKQLFLDMGYTVNSEVNDIDVTAIKDDELIIVEMKKNLNLKLMIQAAKRQRLSSKVYVAVPRPQYKKRFIKEFKDKEYLLRRLELGLILVACDIKKPYAKISFHPKPFDKKKSMAKSKKKRTKSVNEIRERTGDYNTGGSSKEKLITAYKEKAIFIAALLLNNDKMSVKEIRNLSAIENTLSILNKNYYGWFDRVSRGVYSLSLKGKKEISQYEGVIKKMFG